MTALLVQGNRTARMTANRELAEFMSPGRQKMFGFDEFPDDFAMVKINGEDAYSWEQVITDGDRVEITISTEAPEDSITSDNVVDSDTQAMKADLEKFREENADLKRRVEELTSSEDNSASVRGIQQNLRDMDMWLTELSTCRRRLQQQTEYVENAINTIRTTKENISEMVSEIS